MESTSSNGTAQQEQVSVDRISYHCSFAGCNKSYSRKYRLNEHQKIEHGVTDSRAVHGIFSVHFAMESPQHLGPTWSY